MLKQLQRLSLQSQGLTTKYPFGKGKQAALSALERLGYVQIDTLSVVERAHHHTLWSRLPDYQPAYLAQLVEERKAFEYWFHAASYLPMKDYRYALPKMLRYKRGETPYYRNVDSKVLRDVMDKIRIDGPLKTRDFTSSPKKPGSWWNWKPTKVALEKLFMQGDLMICGREGMEKIYDLTERVLPETTDTTEPSDREYAEYLVKTNLRAYGVSTVKQITHLRKGNALRKNTELVLQNMLEEKTVQEIRLDGMPTMYVLSELLENPIKKLSPGIRFLSPFDNAVIHRERLVQLFDYDFRLECYVPKAKRQYGYFCLPILFGDEFIGRMDCKAHRKNNQLELIHLHIEKRQDAIELWLEPLVEAIWQFALFNGCQSIRISQVSPASLSETVKRSFEA